MNITLTPAAENFMRRMAHPAVDRPQAVCRLTVTPGGCAGFAVQFSVEAISMPEDAVLDVNGLHVFVPVASLTLLADATIDYREGASICGLILINPNVRNCGCGSRSAGRGGRHATGNTPTPEHQD